MVVELRGDPKVGIPNDSYCRVVSLPEQLQTWEGHASGSLSLDLKRGWYSLTVVKPASKKNFAVTYSVDYLVGITKEEAIALDKLETHFIASSYTSHGIMHRCQIQRCDYTTNSLADAKIHEASHMGVDILNHPEDVYKMNDEAAQFAPRVTNRPVQGLEIPAPTRVTMVQSGNDEPVEVPLGKQLQPVEPKRIEPIGAAPHKPVPAVAKKGTPAG